MIKKLNKTYIKELETLDKLAFKPLENKLGKYSNKGAKEYFEFTLKKGEIFGYFDEKSKKLIACIGIIINKGHEYAEIENMLVLPQFQGKGIAKELIKFIENYAKKLNLNGLKLNVRCKNLKAIGFYEHSGYQKQAFIMTKRLK